ncbi:MAG: hypothetical protein LBN27_08400 [Prevotellaceae bacterium]|jgi:hypothetical protein|nr:hypothetical protein [Prevotellaceae bacterium]
MKKLFIALLITFCTIAVYSQTNDVVIETQKPTTDYLRNDLHLSAGYFPIIHFTSGSVSYYYGVQKWFWVGAMLTYDYFNMPDWNDYADETLNNRRIYFHYLGFAPAIRFSYVNKPKLKLYSGVAAGVGIVIEGGNVNVLPCPQVTYIGFSYGQKLYFGGEIGLGFKGIFNLNVGYRL